MNDKEIIDRIRNADYERSIKHLYKEFPMIKAGIISSGGNKEMAEEIFNDALLLLIRKVSEPTFELSSKLSTYLFGISRFLWKNELRKQQKKQEVEWNGAIILTELELGYDEEQEERFKAMENILISLSEKCQQIFERLYYRKQTMQEIATALGFSSENSAKTQKYKCMEQAIKQASALNPKSN